MKNVPHSQYIHEHVLLKLKRKDNQTYIFNYRKLIQESPYNRIRLIILQGKMKDLWITAETKQKIKSCVNIS